MSLYEKERCQTCQHNRHTHFANGPQRGCRQRVDGFNTRCDCAGFVERPDAAQRQYVVSVRHIDSSEHAATSVPTRDLHRDPEINPEPGDEFVGGAVLAPYHRDYFTCGWCGEPITDMWVCGIPNATTPFPEVVRYHLGITECVDACYRVQRERIASRTGTPRPTVRDRVRRARRRWRELIEDVFGDTWDDVY